MQFRCPFVLASASPRRRALLSRQGMAVSVDVSDIDESFAPGEDARELVQRLAREKAEDVARRHPDALLLGADTLVVLEGRILGKPASPGEAADMLRGLSGREHQVHTGIALLHPASKRCRLAVETTTVAFAPLSDTEIAGYVAGGSPLDKAGAYGIQDDAGAFFIRGIEGDYYNVVGLPLHRFYRVVQDEFSDLLRP